jgi:hypothetical protein
MGQVGRWPYLRGPTLMAPADSTECTPGGHRSGDAPDSGVVGARTLVDSDKDGHAGSPGDPAVPRFGLVQEGGYRWRRRQISRLVR